MKLCCVSLLGLYAACTMAAPVAAMTINDWDSGLESWRFDFGGSGAVISHDPTVGSPGNPLGALKLEMPFRASQSNNTYAFTGDVFGSPTDLTGDTELLFDLLIAPGSALDAFGNHGFMNFVSRETNGYNWGSQSGRNLAPATGWTTFSIPTSEGLGMSQTRAFTFQLYGGPDQNIDGTVTVWLDNIRTATPIPEPSTLVLSSLIATSLVLVRRRQNR